MENKQCEIIYNHKEKLITATKHNKTYYFTYDVYNPILKLNYNKSQGYIPYSILKVISNEFDILAKENKCKLIVIDDDITDDYQTIEQLNYDVMWRHFNQDAFNLFMHGTWIKILNQDVINTIKNNINIFHNILRQIKERHPALEYTVDLFKVNFYFENKQTTFLFSYNEDNFVISGFQNNKHFKAYSNEDLYEVINRIVEDTTTPFNGASIELPKNDFENSLYTHFPISLPLKNDIKETLLNYYEEDTINEFCSSIPKNFEPFKLTIDLEGYHFVAFELMDIYFLIKFDTIGNHLTFLLYSETKDEIINAIRNAAVDQLEDQIYTKFNKI